MLIKKVGVLMLGMLFLASCNNDTDQDEVEVTDEEVMDNQQDQGNTADPFQPAADVSDEELQKFANVAEKAQVINQEAQQEMMKAVKDAGMDVQRYSAIQQSSQNPNQPSDATEEELLAFDEVNKKLAKIQTDARSDMEEIIEEEGLTEQRFQEINMALQSSPELQQKFMGMQQPQSMQQPE